MDVDGVFKATKLGDTGVLELLRQKKLYRKMEKEHSRRKDAAHLHEDLEFIGSAAPC